MASTDFEKTLKQLLAAFGALKKLDPDDYYKSGMDKLFQSYVVKFANRANIEDPNLLTAIKYAEQNYGNAQEPEQGGKEFNPEPSIDPENAGGFNA